jgi:hypothetical protein
VLPTFWPRASRTTCCAADYAIVMDRAGRAERHDAFRAPTGSASWPGPAARPPQQHDGGWWKLGMIEVRPVLTAGFPAAMKVERPRVHHRARRDLWPDLPPAPPDDLEGLPSQ